MVERSFNQYFGPSRRHDRACIEMSFPLGGEAHRPAPLEPMLQDCGFKLRGDLPEGPLPLEEAVERLASLLLSRHNTWWSRHGGTDGRGWVAIAHPASQASALALDTALDLAVSGTEVSATTARKLRSLAEWQKNMSEIRVWMLAAADMFGRDTAGLNTTTEIYQVGQGVRGLHFYRLANERDTLTGQVLEKSKHVTVDTLQRFGLPTTRGVMLENERDAAKAIERVGLPCVVKPIGMSRGAGVATRLADEAQVAAAAAHALKLSQQAVMVENHVEGHDHRLMVVGDELLWAYRRIPPSVVGDGKATVSELIERENRRRAAIREGTDAYLYKIGDEELGRFLAGRYDIGPDHVLAKGRRIDVGAQANIARGGILEDVTGEVHPDNRALAIRVARLFRIRTMGIDFITPDIARSWREIDCAIVEVNRTPAIWGMGDATLVHRALFPNRRSGRIPTIAVIGDAGYCAAAANLLSTAAAKHRLRLAIAVHPDGGARRAAVTPAPTARAIDTLFLDPEADAAAVLCSAERVERAELPLRRCDLLVVQQPDRFDWLSATADTVLAGKVAPGKISAAFDKLARLHADPTEGGPLPVLEPVEGSAKNEFRLKVWRMRAMPRAWFWSQVGVEAAETAGLTTHQDLLGAVRALADEALDGGAGLSGDFTHDELLGSWVRATFEAAIALPSRHADKARAALLAATERVNAIAAADMAADAARK